MKRHSPRLRTLGRSPDIEADRASVPQRYREMFEGATFLRFVGQVAFDPSQLRAVIGARTVSSGCRSENWKALERGVGGTLRMLPWGTGTSLCS